jgi:predicted nucleic acid-binding protein
VIVVDTNVLAYALIEGAHTKLARRVREQDPVWRVPELWRHEFLNVLAVYTQQGGFDLKQATAVWQAATKLFIPCESGVRMSLVLTLAVENGISAYDAQFAALALSLGAPLVTEDRGLQRKFPGVAVSMGSFCTT